MREGGTGRRARERLAGETSMQERDGLVGAREKRGREREALVGVREGPADVDKGVR